MKKEEYEVYFSGVGDPHIFKTKELALKWISKWLPEYKKQGSKQTLELVRVRRKSLAKKKNY